MSDTTDLDMREQVARIDRMIEESRKFAAEQHKLAAEQVKLTAKAAKFGRERVLQTILALTGVIGGLLTVAQFILRFKAG